MTRDRGGAGWFRAVREIRNHMARIQGLAEWPRRCQNAAVMTTTQYTRHCLCQTCREQGTWCT